MGKRVEAINGFASEMLGVLTDRGNTFSKIKL